MYRHCVLKPFPRCRDFPRVVIRTEDREERFAHVFTKLQGLGLTDYEKVLMMDIDLLVRDLNKLAAGGHRFECI